VRCEKFLIEKLLHSFSNFHIFKSSNLQHTPVLLASNFPLSRGESSLRNWTFLVGYSILKRLLPFSNLQIFKSSNQNTPLFSLRRTSPLKRGVLTQHFTRKHCVFYSVSLLVFKNVLLFSLSRSRNSISWP